MGTTEHEVSEVRQEAIRICGRVKWFNSVKGYGFIAPEGDLGDVFLHHSALRSAGHEGILEGSTVECDAVNGPKGLQAVKILQIDNSTASTSISTFEDDDDDFSLAEPEGDFFIATTKWFNNDKGYGFVTRGEGTPDLFVHIKSLRRVGINHLIPGQSLRVRLGNGPKGPQVAEIDIG